MVAKDRYNFWESREVYTFFKAIYIKKKVTLKELIHDSGKAQSSVSYQIMPLIKQGVIEKKNGFYSVNKDKLDNLVGANVLKSWFFQLPLFIVSAESFNSLIFLYKNLAKQNLTDADFETIYKKLWK